MAKRKLREQIEVLIDKYETPFNDYFIENLLSDAYDVLEIEDGEYKAWEEELEFFFNYMKATYWIATAIKSCKNFDIDSAFKIDWYNVLQPVEDEEVKEYLRDLCK